MKNNELKVTASNICNIIEKLDQPYKKNDFLGLKISKDNFKIIDNSVPILLSAPHAVKQFRESYRDNLKPADMNTGGIVEYLCGSCECNGIIRTFYKKDDPNYYADKNSIKYRNKICKIVKSKKIRLLLDIHGCNNNREYDIYIGTNKKRNLCSDRVICNKLCECLIKTGAKIVVDKELCASKKNNICKEVAAKMNIPCIQIEIRKEWRTTSIGLYKFIMAMESFIQEVRMNYIKI